MSREQNIVLAQPSLHGNEKKYVTDCLDSGWISSQGQYVSRFETTFAERVGTRYACTTSSGTTALHLALEALDITSGDEVLVPDLTFGATANAVLHCGAKPVLVDIDRNSWALDVAKCKAALTTKSKAIIAVHLYGRQAPMNEIMGFARAHNLFVIEDCAESLGLPNNGALADVGCFSFFANKLMTTGEGGMVTTNSQSLNERIRMLRDHGMDKHKRYWHLEMGFNYRLTNLQAAIGLAQLEQLDKFLTRRREIAKRYHNNLADLQFIEVLPSDFEMVWLYSILLSDKFTEDKRAQLIDFLAEKGIQARPFFFPLHMQPAFKSSGEFPVATEVAGRGVSLPSHVELEDNQIDFICECIGTWGESL